MASQNFPAMLEWIFRNEGVVGIRLLEVEVDVGGMDGCFK